MNFLNILRDIEAIDPEITDRISPRRDVIKNMTSFGTKVGIAALPFALGSLLQKAYGQTLDTGVMGVLNFALQLEYLEAEFYNQGVAKSGLIPSADLTAIKDIQDDENAHVAFLKTVLGSNAIAKPTIDLTANNTFQDVLSNYATYLAVAETFEDTGVRAYKGQAPALLGNKTILTAALSIHSVEARHASYIRVLRKSKGATVKPWITGTTSNNGNDTGISAVNASYAGEQSIMQGPVDITTLNGVGGKISYSAASEAFDEPLTKDQILSIVGPFFK
nr:ferritin-like domain-containing protein [uncultured Pedobacter sp.]